jgi:hypothetical protein
MSLIDVASCGLLKNEVSEVLDVSIIRLVNFYETTLRNIPEDIFILVAVRT